MDVGRYLFYRRARVDRDACLGSVLLQSLRHTRFYTNRNTRSPLAFIVGQLPPPPTRPPPPPPPPTNLLPNSPSFPQSWYWIKFASLSLSSIDDVPFCNYFAIDYRDRTRTGARAHSHMHACALSHMHARAHTHTHIHTDAHARAHARTHAHTHIYIYIYIYAHTYTRTHTRVRARAHTHTHLLTLIGCTTQMFVIPYQQEQGTQTQSHLFQLLWPSGKAL